MVMSSPFMMNSEPSFNNCNRNGDQRITMDTIKTEIMHHLIQQPNIFFRSQQINDPDITDDEKQLIVQDLLNSSHLKFLHRFGNFITLNHLEFFEHPELNEAESDRTDINVLLVDLKKKLANKHKIVKNRRYSAMQRMCKDATGYFSEKEMMSRQPYVYDQLIGQYMTDAEKRIRDFIDGEDCAGFSNVLLESISSDHINELRKKQEAAESDESESDNSNDVSLDRVESAAPVDGLYPQIPPSYRQHWGDFEDDIKPTGSKRKCQNYISATEKSMLREEFIGIMHSNFIEGKDSDFDYQIVDENSDYDDLVLQSQDEEDRYFATEEEDDRNGSTENLTSIIADGESEDELDVYMSTINHQL